MKIENLSMLYQYFDNLAEQEASSDDLFASSYIRGFIGLSASEFGDEQQPLSKVLANQVSQGMEDAKTELTPQDRVIVANYWQTLQPYFK